MSRAAMRWAIFGLVFGIVLIVAKWAAFFLTGSAAILSDAIESGVNILTSGFVLYAIWLSNQPRDAEHPYGHGRVEYFSAGFEGALVLFAALSIGAVSIERFIHPVELRQLGLGAGIQLAISVVTLIAGEAIRRAGLRHRSPSLEADGVHIRADAITSFGTFAGILVVWATGILWLDTVAALVVAVWLGISGARVVREAIGGLMDEADPSVLDRVGRTLQVVREPGWVAPHHTKVHNLGRDMHIDLHMVFPRYWSLEKTHNVSETVDAALRAEFGPTTEVMLHMESCTPQSCSYCDMPACPVREEPFKGRYAWDAEHVAAMHRPPPIEGAGEQALDQQE